MAIIHAREKMEEMYIKPVQGTGEFDDGYQWQTEVSLSNLIDDEDLKLFKITVRVSGSSSDMSRSVELVTLKTVLEEDIG
jgi:hypothetical protein